MARPLAAEIVIENKRPVMAQVESGRSCLIDPDLGAFNLEYLNRVLPPKGWIRLYGVVGVNSPSERDWYYAYGYRPSGSYPPLGARQRVLVSVKWDDGRTETADLEYEIVAKEESEDDEPVP